MKSSKLINKHSRNIYLLIFMTCFTFMISMLMYLQTKLLTISFFVCKLLTNDREIIVLPVLGKVLESCFGEGFKTIDAFKTYCNFSSISIRLRPTLITNEHMINGISVDRVVSSCLGIRENLSWMYILFVCVRVWVSDYWLTPIGQLFSYIKLHSMR